MPLTAARPEGCCRRAACTASPLCLPAPCCRPCRGSVLAAQQSSSPSRAAGLTTLPSVVDLHRMGLRMHSLPDTAQPAAALLPMLMALQNSCPVCFPHLDQSSAEGKTSTHSAAPSQTVLGPHLPETQLARQQAVLHAVVHTVLPCKISPMWCAQHLMHVVGWPQFFIKKPESTGYRTPCRGCSTRQEHMCAGKALVSEVRLIGKTQKSPHHPHSCLESAKEAAATSCFPKRDKLREGKAHGTAGVEKQAPGTEINRYISVQNMLLPLYSAPAGRRLPTGSSHIYK